MKTIQKIFIVGMLVVSFSFASAVTKPEPGTNIDNLSYVFYLFYDNGQLFADRDYEVKFDLIQEGYTAESVNETTAFMGEIVNFKSEVANTFKFDPKKGDPDFNSGKIVVRGPYVSNAQSVKFFNSQGQQLVTMFISAASICNDDGFCDEAAGENEQTCVNDCKKPRTTPVAPVIEESSGFFGGFDLNTILIYVVGSIGVLVLAWLGWKWWKKKRGESFLPPPPSIKKPTAPTPPSPTGGSSSGGLPPLGGSGGGLPPLS